MTLLTAAQMRAIEQAAIKSGKVTGLELMERAGRGVVDAILAEWPELERVDAGDRPRALVLCGPGNNGGDGFVVARLLHGRGWDVEAFLDGDRDKLPPDAKTNYERWTQIAPVAGLSDEAIFKSRAALSTDGDLRGVVVDALFGTGLSRPLGQGLRNSRGLPRSLVPLDRLKYVCVDMPSDICSDSGKILTAPGDDRISFHTDLTVTFHRAKVGHYIGDTPEVSGPIRIVDIGLDPELVEAPEFESPEVRLLTGCDRGTEKAPAAHKYDHGHALVLSGGMGRTGAARLAARGALRIGAGLVTIGAPGAAQMEVAAQITALMMRRVDDGADLSAVLQDMRVNALCLGPGLGLERARALTAAALGESGARPRATVLDADALTAFAETPETLLAMVHEGCVLTPHGGEFARLFPDIAAKLCETPEKGPAYSKVDATRDAAARAGCVVLFKGPDTVIAAPDGQCSVNAAVYERATPWLATAGSGDVLAGFITGLLARGLDPMIAAQTGAWLHVEAARTFGPGLIAEDIPEALPALFRNLGFVGRFPR